MTKRARGAVDVAIIGAGSAGLAAQREVSRHTDSYVVIDPGPLGTSCARQACMPSKALLQVAAVRELFTHPPPGLSPELALDGAAVLEHVRTLRDSFVEGVLQDMADWREHLISRRAEFIDPNTLDLQDEILHMERCIIATGSTPTLPDAWQPWADILLGTADVFELTSLPQSLVVIGLGPAGLELGQGLMRLGVDVTGIDPERGIGGLSDPEIQDYAIDTLSKRMPLHIAPAEICSADADRVVINVAGTTIKAQRALTAIGRQPALAGLGLEKLGVHLNDQGKPDFDAQTLQIGELPIFLAGDVNGVRPLLHEAADEGRIAGFNATQASAERFTRRTPMAIAFTSPTIARTGLGYAQLVEENRNFVQGCADFEHQGRARIMNTAKGLIKLYADAADGKLLGAEMFAPDAEHLVHLLAWAVDAGMHIKDMLTLPYYHPVLEEGLRSAVRDAASQLHPPVTASRLMRCDDNPVA